MTDPETSPTQDVDQLASRVDDLLDQMQAACEDVAARFSDDEAVDDDLAALLAESEQPDAASDEQTDEAEEQPSNETAEPTPEPADSQPAADDSSPRLDADVDDGLGDELEALLAEAEGDDNADEPEPPAEAEPPVESITELDEHLAQQTEAMLDGDQPPGEPVPSPAQAEPAAAPSPREPTAKPPAEPSAKPAAESADRSPSEQSAAQPTAEPNAEPAEQPAAQPTERPTPKPAPLPDGRLAPVIAASQAFGSWSLRTGRVAATHAEPTARKLATALAKPLDSQPPVVKQTIGWIGLWTLFLAACVWITLAMFRTAPAPAPTTTPAGLETQPDAAPPPQTDPTR